MLALKLLSISILLNISNIQIEAYSYYNETKIPSPLILIPGDGGSRAYSNLNYHIYNLTRLVWVNFEYMLFPYWLKRDFMLNYNPKTHKTSDAEGSYVFFPGWGSTDTIEELDEYIHKQTTYFSPLVNSLTKDKFYIRDKTLRGAPYDFRKAPNENEIFFTQLKTLVEDTYKNSANQKVVILGHSLGSLYSILFLKTMSKSWKQKYVRTFISVSGPFAGAVKALYLETSGDSLGSPRNPIYFREMQRSFPSIMFLLPKFEIYGNKSLIITPKRNYSAYDYKALFEDMSMTNGNMMYDDVKNLFNVNEEPEDIDEVYCIYGYGFETAKQLIFTSFPDKQPQVVHGDGDCTVNIESLEVCKRWKNTKYFSIKGANHMEIVGIPEFITKLKQILYRQPSGQFPVSDGITNHKFAVQYF